MRLRTIVLGLVPGVAHVDQGRIKRGLAYFFCFTFLLNGALMAPMILPATPARTAAWVGAVGIWLVAFLDACRWGPGPDSGGNAPPAAPAQSTERKTPS
jgi:hypothetical protein